MTPQITQNERFWTPTRTPKWVEEASWQNRQIYPEAPGLCAIEASEPPQIRKESQGEQGEQRPQKYKRHQRIARRAGRAETPETPTAIKLP